MNKILVVEDDGHIRKLIVKFLNQNGFETVEAENGRAGLFEFEHQHVDMIISDIMMPEMDGNAFVYRVRSNNKDLPILMLTALDSYEDKEKSFLSGSDDYMVKPIDFNEMILRVKALLRRYQIASVQQIHLPHMKLDERSLSATMNGENIGLTKKEFQLLFKLLSSPNQIFTREQLMNDIWGYESESQDRTVDTHIKRLREALVCVDFEIITVRGIGYKAVLT